MAMTRRVASAAVLAITTYIGTFPAVAQNFSCRGGTQPACLDYGAKVCNSLAKCVAQDAVVFDSFTCNYKGFVCKSALDDVADKHDMVVRKFNNLLDENNTLVDQYNSLLRKARDVDSCVRGASTIEDARSCLR